MLALQAEIALYSALLLKMRQIVDRLTSCIAACYGSALNDFSGKTQSSCASMRLKVGLGRMAAAVRAGSGW